MSIICCKKVCLYLASTLLLFLVASWYLSEREGRASPEIIKNQILDFSLYFDRYCMDRKALPEAKTFRELLLEIQNWPGIEKIINRCPLLFRNRDPWGGELVYEVRLDGDMAIVSFRSLGANGEDENGNGDDVSFEMYYSAEYMKSK